jgi:hypothetical protein
MTAAGVCDRCGGELIPTGCQAGSCADQRMCMDCGRGCDLLLGGACAVIDSMLTDLTEAEQ